jgi:hypothetical protein
MFKEVLEMKKRVLIGSIFMVLLMLSTTAISSIQAQPKTIVKLTESNECEACASEEDEPCKDGEPCKPLCGLRLTLWQILRKTVYRGCSDEEFARSCLFGLKRFYEDCHGCDFAQDFINRYW